MPKDKSKKKAGMVLIIGMGAKDGKSVKKADEEQSTRRATRGRGSAGAKRAGELSTFAKLKKNPALMDKILASRRIDPNEFHGELLRVTGKNYDELLEEDEPSINIQEFIDHMADRGHQSRSNDTRAQQIIEGFKGIPDHILENRQIPREAWDAVVGNLQTSDIDVNDSKEQLSNLIDSAASGQAGSRSSHRKLYRGAQNEMRMRQRFGDDFKTLDELGGEQDDKDLAEHDPQGVKEIKDEEDLQRIMQLLIARGSNNPEEEAMHHLGLRDQAPKHDKYPGRGIQGTVQASPSTEFQRPYEWSGNKLSSPQSEAEEEFNRVYTSSDSSNVMDEAMALLKGNPKLRDINNKNIDHPAALTYAHLPQDLQNSLEYHARDDDVWDQRYLRDKNAKKTEGTETSDFYENMERDGDKVHGSSLSGSPNFIGNERSHSFRGTDTEPMTMRQHGENARRKAHEGTRSDLNYQSNRGHKRVSQMPPSRPRSRFLGSARSPAPPLGIERMPRPEEEGQDDKGSFNYAKPLPRTEEQRRDLLVNTSSDSRNVMDEAMALLKGNRDMRDANDRNIDHTAALTYDNLASQAGQDVYNNWPKDDQRKNAREQTSNTLAYGNEDNSPSKNHGVERMPRPEEEQDPLTRHWSPYCMPCSLGSKKLVRGDECGCKAALESTSSAQLSGTGRGY